MRRQSGGRPTGADEGYRSAAGFAAGVCLALVLALLAGPGLAVLGLVACGALHNWLELRYLLGTYASTSALSELLPGLLVLIGGIVVCRLLIPGDTGHRCEIVLSTAVLGMTLVRCLRPSPPLRAGALGVLGLLTVGSLVRPDLHFIALTHLHNLLPALFVWHWAGELGSGARRVLRGTQVAWALVVPTVVLTGICDAALPRLGGLPLHASTAALVDSLTPPGWRTDPVALRLVTVFAFLQTVHYLIWCWFLPRHDRGAAARFTRQWQAGRALTGWRFPAAATGCVAVLGSIFYSDYRTGRAVYLSFTSFHAYLELTVLLCLIGPITRRILARPDAAERDPVATRV